MNLNQVTLPVTDFDRSVAFHRPMGFGLIVVVYFECQAWGWREARMLDPSGNELCLFSAGEFRKDPPWRVRQDA